MMSSRLIVTYYNLFKDQLCQLVQFWAIHSPGYHFYG